MDNRYLISAPKMLLGFLTFSQFFWLSSFESKINLIFVFFSAGQSQEMDRNIYKFNKHPLIKDCPNVLQLNCVACIYHRKRQVFLLSSDVLTFWLQNPGSSMFDAIFNRPNKSFLYLFVPMKSNFFLMILHTKM